jgi:hypothetical protein
MSPRRAVWPPWRPKDSGSRLSNATGFGPQTTTLALVLLPVVLFLGIATYSRVVEIN